MRSALIAVVGAVVAAVAAVAAPARADAPAYAIVIGNNAPPREGTSEALGPLRYADDDAVRYEQLFARFATTRLLAVLDGPTQRRHPGVAGRAEAPTLDNLRRAVNQIAERMAEDRARGDRPVFYLAFSGHGARSDDGEVFLALEGGGLTEEILFDDVLAALPSAYSHLLIDACHAGGVVGARGFFDVQIDGETAPVEPAEASKVVSRRIDEFPHVGYIVATTAGQEAHEWSAVESGVFTHALVSGLLGPADINGDLRVEYSEAQAFAASAVRDLPDPRAAPAVIARPPRAHQSAALVALEGLADARLLTGRFGELGHFHIELENGQRYLDAHLAAGEPGAIALPAGQRAFLRTDTREAAIPSGAARLADLELRERLVAARGSLDHAYRAALFASAYGSDYYRGFVDSVGAIGVRFGDRRPDLVDTGGTSSGGHRGAAVAAASIAGVSALASVGGGVWAYRAKRDFDRTDLQRPAYEAKQRYERNLIIAGAAGAAAVTGAAVAWWLWPDREPAVAPSASARGEYALSFRMSW